MKICSENLNIFIKKDVIITVYVDDLFIVGPDIK
jgi:hypothetical protein